MLQRGSQKAAVSTCAKQVQESPVIGAARMRERGDLHLGEDASATVKGKTKLSTLAK